MDKMTIEKARERLDWGSEIYCPSEMYEARMFIEGWEARQPEIDEWMKDRDNWFERFKRLRTDSEKEIDELKKEIERLKIEIEINQSGSSRDSF
jgi:hypothetical protein